jgi:F-type H+-transporting ATPase subunit delta
MNELRIANRYARALADVITERGETDDVIAELNRFGHLMDKHSELRDVFASPVVNLERKRAVLNELLERMKLRSTSNNFLRLLLDNSRLQDLNHMLNALLRELDLRTDIISAEITTAREMPEPEKMKMRERIKAATGKEVRLQFRSDPQIIGGVITRIGSMVYDGSIKNQLTQMKQILVSYGEA